MRKILLLCCLFMAPMFTNGQVGEQSILYKSILSKDSLLFSVGFNTCDIVQFENLLSNKFEFYHDKDSVSDKATFIYNLRNGLCATPAYYQSRRELMLGNSEVYPLYHGKNLYGAIQIGTHKFYERIDRKEETYASTAKFTHVWQLENGQWKLTKSLSFDHQTKITSTTDIPIFDRDSDIELWLKENKVPTLGLGIIENGKLKQVKVVGEITSGVSVPYNTIFNVASLTKPITAMVALRLVSLGKWNLDEPLHTYWTDPDIANDPRHKRITTRMIVSHQVGFPNWRWMNADGKLSFQFDPGAGYQYSGEGYEYLRKALEKKFRKSLHLLAKEILFDPIGMNDTRYIWDKTIDTTRLAFGFNPSGKPYALIKRKTPNAADDLLTTIEDYGKFLVSVMNGDGLTKNVFQEMSTNQVATRNGKYFGLGMEIYHFEDGNFALSHGGADEGVQTIVFIFPKTKQGLLIFTNVDDGYKVYEKLIGHYLGDYGKKIIEIENR